MIALVMAEDAGAREWISWALAVTGWTVRATAAPVRPEGVDVALVFWGPSAPRMLDLCLFAAVPAAVVAPNVSVVDRVVPIVTDPAPAALDAALRRILL